MTAEAGETIENNGESEDHSTEHMSVEMTRTIN